MLPMSDRGSLPGISGAVSLFLFDSILDSPLFLILNNYYACSIPSIIVISLVSLPYGSSIGLPSISMREPLMLGMGFLGY